VSMEFQNAVRDKLNSFNLSDEQLSECLEWLPPSKTSLNVIIIPDLSNRIVLLPDQIKNDHMVLEAIWSSFVDLSKYRQNTQDRLMIDVTDIEQAKGQFSSIADKLQFDLSSHRGKSNRLYFTDNKNVQFNNGISNLYKSAYDRPLGADYIFYFRRYLKDRLRKPTLYNNYSNKVIILTDGYLELQESKDYGVGSRWDYTVRNSVLYNAASNGDIRVTISDLGLNIPKAPGLSLENVELLVCEVSERAGGRTKDFEILKAYWEDWFERMNAEPSNIKFIQREQSGSITRGKIKEFMQQQ